MLTLNKMKLFIFFLFMILSMAFTGCGGQNKIKQPVSIKGLLDLRNWDFKKDGMIEIKGDMEFYWNKLLSPDVIDKHKPDAYSYVPEVWNKQKIGGKNLPALGHATYRMKILLPENSGNLQIALNQIYSAYDCWIDGKLAVKSGVLTVGTKGGKGSINSRLADLDSGLEYFYMTINVSNYFFSQAGGISQSIYIGLPDDIYSKSQLRIFFYLMSFGIFFIMFVYHFWFWILRKNEIHYLYFSIFCLLMTLQALFSGKIVYIFFSDFNLEIYYKAWYLIFALFPLALMFYRCLYPDEIRRIIVRISLAIYGFCILIDIVLPVYIFSKFTFLFYFTGILILVYLLYAGVLSVIRNRDLSLLFLSGLLIPVMTGINDILHSINIIQTYFLTPFGLMTFMIIQSYAIALKFTRSFRQVELLTSELEDLNVNLENKVCKRTKSLQDAMNVIEQKNAEIIEQKRILESTYEKLTIAHNELSIKTDQLQNLATRDSLTDIANKRMFYEFYNYEWEKALRNREFLSIIFIDVDLFKNYNDTYGHISGDDVLKKLGHFFSKIACRPSDLVARYGGEEFIIILTKTDKNGAMTVAERLRQGVLKMCIEHKSSVVSKYLTISIGISSIVPDRNIDKEALIVSADQALYGSKKYGRNRISYSDVNLDIHGGKASNREV